MHSALSATWTLAVDRNICAQMESLEVPCMTNSEKKLIGMIG